MHVRCPHCRASTWLNLNRATGTKPAACKACARRFEPTIDEIRNRSARLGRGDAIAFADLHGVDLFSAHSVLLGLMPVARAKEIRSERPAPPIGASPMSVPTSRRELARRRRQAKGVVPAAPLDTVDLRNYLIVILLGAMGLASIAWSTVHLLNRETRLARHLQEAGLAAGRKVPTPGSQPWFDDDAATATWIPGEARPSPPPAEIERGPEGLAVRITAGHPLQVLEAYCALRPTGFRRSMGLAEAGPVAGSSRFGMFQDSESDGPPRAIQIRKDLRTRRWSAGDGRIPIPTFPADAVLMAAGQMGGEAIPGSQVAAEARWPVSEASPSPARLGWGEDTGGRATTISSDSVPAPVSVLAPAQAR